MDNETLVAIALTGALAILFQTWLSLSIALNPPQSAVLRKLFVFLIVVSGTTGVVAGAFTSVAEIMGDAELVNEVKNGNKERQREAERQRDALERMSTKPCMTKEDVQRVLLVMHFRDTFMRDHPGYSGVWPPAEDINAFLKQARAKWRVTINPTTEVLDIVDCKQSNILCET